jgi:hypothetical protein
MKSWQTQNVQVGPSIVKQDARVPEHSELTVEALSRWENEGGAPEQRNESDNRMAKMNRQ